MDHQDPCSFPGPTVIAVEDAGIEQVLENDVKRRDEIVYDFVGDILSSNCCCHIRNSVLDRLRIVIFFL